MKNAARILAVTEVLPKPDRAAGDRRFAAVLRLLAQQHHVDLLIDMDERRGRTPIHCNDWLRYRRLMSDAGVRIVGDSILQGFGQAFRGGYDLLIFEFVSMARRYSGALRKTQPMTPQIVDSVDLGFLREEAMLAIAGGDATRARQTKELELQTFRASDGVIVITDVEEATLLAEANMPSLYRIPIIVPSRPRAVRPRGRSLLFVGGFKHLPNVDAIQWFIAECWPTIRARFSDVTLTIVGPDAPPDVVAAATQPGITLAGFVPDVGPYLDDAAVSIAPLRFGAGMKGKVNEAMSAGCPVVTTSFGVQGIAATPGEHVLVANDSIGFADAVVDLLANPARAQEIGRAGQAICDRVCGEAFAREAISAMMQDAVTVVAGSTLRQQLRQRLGAAALLVGLSLRRIQFLRTFFARTTQQAAL